MTLALRLAWRYARQRPARSLATLLGVMAGVAGLRAIDLGTRGALTSVQAAYEEASGLAALTVTPAGDTRGPLPAGVLAKLDATPGIEAALPLVQETSERSEDLAEWNAPLAPGEVSGVLVLGVDFVRERGRSRWRLAQGTESNGVLVGEAWASSRKLSVGGTLRLIAGNSPTELRIAGAIGREGLGTRNYGRVVIAPIDVVRSSFSLRPGEIHDVALVLAPGARPADVAARVREQLGPAVSVVTAAERGKDVAQRLGNIRAGTDLTSSVALFLAAFLIYGLYATAAAERRRDLGMLRAIGATRTQAALPMVLEAVLVALPGGALGAFLGGFMAKGVSATLSKVAGAELRVPPPNIAGAVRVGAIGLLVAIAAATWPAIRAAREDTLSQLRALGAAAEPPRRWASLAWGAGVLVALALLALHPPRTTNPGTTYVLVLSLLAACTGVLPALIGPIAGALSPRLVTVFGGAVALGVASPRWRPGRSGLAAGAVLGCVALVGGISALGTGMRVEMSDWADHSLSWDLFVRRPSGLGADSVRMLRGQPGVQRAAEAMLRPAEVKTSSGHDLSLTLVGLDAQAYDAESLFTFDPGTTGDQHALTLQLVDGAHAFATTVVAEQFGLKPGTVVTVETPRGPRTLTISGEIVDYTQNGFALVMDTSFLADNFDAVRADLVAIRVKPDARIDDVVSGLSRVPGVKIERRGELKARVMKLVEESMGSMDGLLWLSGLIGLLAVGAAVAQGAIERRRDIAALRSLGMTRGQVAAMICSESVLTALVGGTLGAGVGLYLGWVFAESTHTLGIPIPFVPPWRALLLSLTGVTASAIPAAWFPARRAIAVPPGEALRSGET